MMGKMLEMMKVMEFKAKGIKVKFDEDSYPMMELGGKYVRMVDVFGVQLFGDECIGKEVVQKNSDKWDFRKENLMLVQVI